MNAATMTIFSDIRYLSRLARALEKEEDLVTLSEDLESVISFAAYILTRLKREIAIENGK